MDGKFIEQIFPFPDPKPVKEVKEEKTEEKPDKKNKEK